MLNISEVPSLNVIFADALHYYGIVDNVQLK